MVRWSSCKQVKKFIQIVWTILFWGKTERVHTRNVGNNTSPQERAQVLNVQLR